NLGQETYVLPREGIMFDLPPGHLAFQSQAVMTDQHFEEVRGRGFRLRGSFPPGHVSLAWAYDLPVSYGEMRIPVQIPFATFTYRVMAEALPGLTLRVDGM